MRPIVTDGLSVGMSVCHNREPCKTAEPTEMPFWVENEGGPK